MTVHAIDKPDHFAGDEPRRILWDDEAGEVSGDHSDVPRLRETLARAELDGHLPHMEGRWPMRDPRRDPAEFVVALFWPGSPRMDELPPSLRGVEPAAFVEYGLSPGEVA